MYASESNHESSNWRQGEMITYIYSGKRFCEECGLAIRGSVISSGKAPKNPGIAWSYDSNDFPKGPYYAQYEKGIPDLLCASGQNCLCRPGGAVVGSEYDSMEDSITRDPWTDVDASLLLEDAVGPRGRMK